MHAELREVIMQTIYKYGLTTTDRQNVVMPIGARILSVENQREGICVWALVDPKIDTELVEFIIHGTGHDAADVGDGSGFIGTVQLYGGELIFHVFKGKVQHHAD